MYIVHPRDQCNESPKLVQFPSYDSLGLCHLRRVLVLSILKFNDGTKTGVSVLFPMSHPLSYHPPTFAALKQERGHQSQGGGMQ